MNHYNINFNEKFFIKNRKSDNKIYNLIYDIGVPDLRLIDGESLHLSDEDNIWIGGVFSKNEFKSLPFSNYVIFGKPGCGFSRNLEYKEGLRKKEKVLIEINDIPKKED